MDKEELQRRVSEAFADVPYPGDERIAAPGGRDDGEYVAELLRGRTWQSLEAGELWDASLSFMTREAFRYYLPAYLLVWDNEDAGDASSAYFFHLMPPGAIRWKGAEEEFAARFRDFTPAQKKVISEFLDFVHGEIRGWWQEHGGMDKEKEREWLAVRAYWKRFA